MTLKEQRKKDENRCEVCVWFELDDIGVGYCTHEGRESVTPGFFCTAFERKELK